MDIQSFFISLLKVVCEMAPYLLLGFFIAGVLHVFVPQKFYANYLSRNNKLSMLWAALARCREGQGQCISQHPHHQRLRYGRGHPRSRRGYRIYSQGKGLKS
jgi:hypothetical protein